MKVLHLINSLQRGGGAEKFLCDLSIAQSKSNKTDIGIINLLKPENNDFIDICSDNDISFYNLYSSKYSIRGLLKLRNIIETEKPDVLHVHLFPVLYYAALLSIICKHKFKLVYTEHSTSNKRRKYKFFRFIDKQVYSRYDVICAISEQVAQALVDNNVCNTPVIINNGVNISEIQKSSSLDLRKELNLDSESFIVTMVARFCEIKDHNTVIKAAKKLPANIHVVLVGDGETMLSCKELVNSLNLENRVHFLGLRKDVYSILKGSDAVVLSTHHEGFSISMLEAMACKKPFVASSVPGIKDLVSGVAALFEYQNVDGLAEIIQNLSLNNQYYEELSNLSYDFALNFDINNIASKYIDIYKSTI